MSGMYGRKVWIPFFHLYVRYHYMEKDDISNVIGYIIFKLNNLPSM